MLTGSLELGVVIGAGEHLAHILYINDSRA